MKTKKFVNYLQISICSLIVVVAITLIFNYFVKGLRYSWNAGLAVNIIAILVALITIVIIREIKYFNYDGSSSANVGWIIGVGLTLIIALLILNNSEYEKARDVLFYLIIVAPAAWSLRHLKYGIACAISILTTAIFAAYFFEGGMGLDVYFVTLFALLGSALVGFVIKLVFFTKWSNFKKEEKAANEL